MFPSHALLKDNVFYVYTKNMDLIGTLTFDEVEAMYLKDDCADKNVSFSSLGVNAQTDYAITCFW